MQSNRTVCRTARAQQNRREWCSWVVAMGTVAAGTLLTLVFAVVAVVDGHSMEPGLRGGDSVLVSRLSYAFSPPERGDVVMCRYPHTGDTHYIKRVIALPGETVEIRDGRVYVDGIPLAEGYIDERAAVGMEPFTLRMREYFVMGDNRNHSTDSRDPRVGPIPAERVAGKAVAVVWPLSRLRSLPQPYYQGDQQSEVSR